MSFGFGFGFPKRLTSGGGLSPSLYLDFVGTGVLPSTVTFSRGTNATLTDSNGRIAWAPHNLLVNSEDFEAAAWGKFVSATVAANTAIAPDGTTTADTLTLTATANSRVEQTVSVVAGATYTFSVWMRVASGTLSVRLYGIDTGSGSAFTVTTEWQRFSITQVASSSSRFPAIVTDGTAGNVFLWGAQLNVANAPVNLLTWSEQFDNAAWSKTNTLVAANVTVAPDGTTTADKVIADTSNSQHFTRQIVASLTGTFTFSVYAKASGVNYLILRENASVGYRVAFNLTTGTIGQTSTPAATPTIQSVGNGWYRCSISVPLSAQSFGCASYLSQVDDFDSPPFAGNGTDGIFLWGAQLNTGSVALPYVATTSSIYLPPAYNSTTPKNLLGFTQEPENAAWTKSNSYVQQNLLTWSQDFDNAAWLKRDGSVTDNATTAPDGTLTADKLIPAAASVIGRTQQNYIGSADTTYTLSVYAKQGEFSALRLYADDNASNIASVYFNLISGAITTGPAVSGTWTGVSATSAPANAGWYRFTLTWTATGAAPVRFQFWNPNTGDGTSGIFIWGAQLVQGSTAGDYTQTTSAAAPTRYLNWDGTLTGRKLVENTAAAVAHRVQQTVTIPSAPISGTAYLKAGEREWAYLRFDDASSTKFAYFNLTTGVVGTVDSGLTATVVNAGGGWYRCSAVFASPAATASGVFVVGTATANNTQAYTGDGTSGIYVSDFQLSNSASVDPYVYNPQAAAASAAYYGPRFDYDPVTLAAKGLLIEEQRTNLCLYSAGVGGTGWTTTISGTGVTPVVTTNFAVAPDGTTTASRIQVSLGGGTTTVDTTLVFQGLTSASSSRGSFYIKTNDGSSKTVYVRGQFAANFTVDGTWRRYDFDAGTLAGAQFGIGLRGGQTPTNSDTADLLVWGAQLEAGSFATSYVPTQASQVTRNADSASMLGDNFYTWYNPNQGTVYAEGTSASVGGNPKGLVDLSNGTVNESMAIYFSANLDSTTFDMRANNLSQMYQQPSGLKTKNALAYKLNDSNAAFNGAVGTTDTSCIVTNASRLVIGNIYSQTNVFATNGTIRRIGYYNTRLPDSTLQALTV